MNNCPCCSSALLRHARHSGVYWFCPHCWQEMPDLAAMVVQPRQRVQQLERLIDLSTISSRPSRPSPLEVRSIA